VWPMVRSAFLMAVSVRALAAAAPSARLVPPICYRAMPIEGSRHVHIRHKGTSICFGPGVRDSKP